MKLFLQRSTFVLAILFFSNLTGAADGISNTTPSSASQNVASIVIAEVPGAAETNPSSASDVVRESVLRPVPLEAPLPSVAIAESCERCSDRCIKYKHHATLRKTCRDCDSKCADPIKAVLLVKDPCCCCEVAVDVCLPACCTDAPKICNERGLLGRNVVVYEWCCGYKVRVVFDRNGDLMVHSYGR